MAAHKVTDLNDPHGNHSAGHGDDHHDHHGHTILPMWLLLVTISALMLLTVATVAVAQGEVWFMEITGYVLPHWVNVVVALSIATVKAIIVLAIFMQLYFDKPLNTAVFTSCILCVALFLGFSMLDLGTRDFMHTRNDGHITTGGNGYGLELRGAVDAEGNDVTLSGLNVVQAARQRAILSVYGTEEALDKATAKKKGKDYDALSTPDRHVARTGLTPGLFDDEAPASATSTDH